MGAFSNLLILATYFTQTWLNVTDLYLNLLEIFDRGQKIKSQNLINALINFFYKLVVLVPWS